MTGRVASVVIRSPPDASTGCADVVEAVDAGCVEVASSRADLQPQAPVAPKTIRQFETALRALGFSQNESKAIAKRGFKAVDTAAVEIDELEQLAALLKRNVQILKD